MGGRQAPVVSECFYKNGFLTYLSFFWTNKWKNRRKLFINSISGIVLVVWAAVCILTSPGPCGHRISLCYEERKGKSSLILLVERVVQSVHSHAG